jgi:hypothetical protein
MVSGFHITRYRREDREYRASWFQIGSRILRYREVPGR